MEAHQTNQNSAAKQEPKPGLPSGGEPKPYIPAGKIVPELTVTSVLLGILLAVIFGGANAYLGLRAGLTVSASIPAAVVSMGILRLILKRNSILENNMVQTIGSAGESVAAGAIFTLPALFMWAADFKDSIPSLGSIVILTLLSSILGVLFMVPLRRALIVQEHATLPYPEGTACAKVLLAGENGGSKASTVFCGMGAAAGYKFASDGLKLFPSEIHWEPRPYRGSGFGVDVLPALTGVGYICGPRISSYMLAGGALGWLVLMPLLYLFGGDSVIYPGSSSIAAIFEADGAFGLWGSYIRYIGAGAVAAGGIFSLIKSLPLILSAFSKTAKGFHGGKEKSAVIPRTDRNIDPLPLAAAVLISGLLLWLSPSLPFGPAGTLFILLFGFFFAAVSSRMVGLVGSSNNPVSGMTIATLLLSCALLKASGSSGRAGMTAAIAAGSVICIIASIAGDTSQDLKTGYLLGATPAKQQIGELIGVTAASLAIGSVLYLLHLAWGYGSAQLPAPQATLMKLVVEGVMGGNLPWTLLFIGAFLAVVMEILGIPVLPVAVGLYLPVHLSVAIMSGGLIRLYHEKRKSPGEERRQDVVENGVLYSSGMIAGEGLTGILLAVLAVIPLGNGTVSSALSSLLDGVLPSLFHTGPAGLVFFALLLFSLLFFSEKKYSAPPPGRAQKERQGKGGRRP